MAIGHEEAAQKLINILVYKRLNKMYARTMELINLAHKRNSMKLFLFLAAIIGIVACSPHQDRVPSTQGKNELKYAKQFRVEKHTEGKFLVELMNPWSQNAAPLVQYYLVPKTESVPTNLNPNFRVIRTPVANIATMSASHIGFLARLGLEDKIIAHSEFKYIYNSPLNKAIEAGKITEIGSDQGVNVESILELSPAILMATVYEKISPKFKLIEKAGIPIAYNIEWMETSPLARAEWVKFAALFFGKWNQADSIFNTIEEQYLAVKQRAQKSKETPHVLCGVQWKGTWYIPGGNSYIAELIRDAGGTYSWIQDSTSGSLPLSIENVLDKEMNADYWINPDGMSSLTDIIRNDERNTLFTPFTTGEVYAALKRTAPNGANDYWESGMVNPHLILEDYVRIFHPEEYPNRTFHFYKKLEQE